MTILIINICKEKLHYFEFVKPIEDILKNNKIKFQIKYYEEISDKDITNAEKIIICGTSLKDNEFLKNIRKFKWIKDCNNSILGICGGMQVIGLIFGGKLKGKSEIGFYDEIFTKEFLGINKGQKQQVYHLHNNYTTLPHDFIKYTSSKIPQAIKHKTKNIFGVLFHPEVRNKEMIKIFCGL